MQLQTLQKYSECREWGFDEEGAREAIAAAAGLRELLAKHAVEGDLQRYPGPEVIKALDDARLWALAVPKRLGGRGLSATALARVGAELAKGDPSVAWVFQIINGTTWVTSLASDALQEELFKDGVPKIAGVFNPPGIAVPVEGGYRVSGAWPYASAIRHAAWGQWGIKIVNPDGTEVAGNFCYVPASDFRVTDTWFVTGMQGTGSDTVVIEDVFVPEHRVVHAAKSYNFVEPDKRNHGANSDFFAQMALVHRTMCGVPLGAMEALLDHVSRSATSRPLVGTIYARQSDSDVVAREIGEAATKIHAARVLIESATMELDEAALDRRVLSEDQRARNKAKANYAMAILQEASRALMNVAGSSAFNNGNPASRYWRDFEMVSRHFGNIATVGYQVYGQSLLGSSQRAALPFMY